VGDEGGDPAAASRQPRGDDIVARVYGSADFGTAVKAFTTK